VQSNLQEHNEALLPVRTIVCEYSMLRKYKRTQSALMERALVEVIRDISCECARRAKRRDEKKARY